jgi:hypothetical protein
MTDVWQLANIEQEEFAAASSLFATHNRQQSVHRPPLVLDDGDDSSDEEDLDDDWQTTKACEGLHQATDHILKDKFLDRLSEVLAREKTADSPKHVAAAAWVDSNHDSPTTILLAKNEGLDDRDRKMSTVLQIWLRAVSATGKAPVIENDTLWAGVAGSEGLVGYSRCRLEFYVAKISQCKLDVGRLDAHASSIGQLQRLCELCRTFDKDIPETTSLLSKIVNHAYELRYNDWHGVERSYVTKVLRPVSMLGRLRAAYECFKATALSTPEFTSIRLESVEPLSKSGKSGIEINVDEFCKHRRIIAENIGRKCLIKGHLARRYSNVSRLHVHAEMQILVNLETTPSWRQRAHCYVGTSKKLCFLCHELLRNYVRLSATSTRSRAFRARKSHGKFYPLWTLPSIPATAEFSVGLSVAAAITQTHGLVLQLLSNNLATLQPPMAESSAGVTERDTFVDSRLNELKRQHLGRQRDFNSSTSEREKEDTFGQKVKTVQVIRIPADGSEPKLVPIAFHALPTNPTHKIPECGFYLVPDFREYWASCHLGRKFRKWTVENQPNVEIEGDYLIYRNETVDLPENMYIKQMLGVDCVDPSRRFYYGDIFIAKFTQHRKTVCTVHDISGASFMQSIAVLKATFMDEWSSKFLDLELEDDQFFGAQTLQWETDREIVYQRMCVTSTLQWQRYC